MPKPTIIDTPFPTVAEVARELGVSKTQRKRIERQIEEFLTRDAAGNRRAGRKVAGMAPALRARNR